MTAPLPLADARALAPAARKARIARIVLTLVLLMLVVAAFLVARHPHASSSPYLPSGSNGVVVLDLSASISANTFDEIGTTLGKLASSGGRYGLVVFSSSAYEALPPGTPARELASYARYFHATVPGPGYAPVFPVNPWTQTFSEGTSISRGLDLARGLIANDRLPHAALILISDLDDDPGDLRRLAGSALAIRKAHIPLRVVELSAQASNEQLFQRLFPGKGTITAAPAPGTRPAPPGAPLPWWLLAAAVLVAVLLAASELLAPVLRVPREVTA